jgi:hypothetical protein
MLLRWTTCSRVGKPSDLFVYTPEEKTKNIVYSKTIKTKKRVSFKLN